MIITRPENCEAPVEIDSSVFGKYKNEVDGDILTYYSLGPKNYCLRTKTKKGVETTVKCRGFHLVSENAKKEINIDTYEEFVNALTKENEALVKLVPQFKITYSKKTMALFSELQLKAFCSHVFNKRIIVKESNDNDKAITFSLPFGYNIDMLNDAKKISDNN